MEREPLISRSQKQWILRIAGVIAMILIFIVYFKSEQSYKEKQSCKRFHKGTFTYYSTLDSKSKLITIKNGVHLETNKEDSSYIVSAIRWFSDCHYRLEVIEVDSMNSKVSVGDLMEVKIDHSEEDTSFLITRRGRKENKRRLVKLR